MSSELLEKTQGERQPLRILDEVAELQARLSRIESLIQQATALALQQAQRADEVQKTFEATVAALEAQLREKESKANQEDSGLGGQDQGLATRIQDLENQLREKEGLLEIRNGELKDLRSKLEEAAALAAAETKRTQDVEQNFEANVAVLKTQLGEKEELLSQKGAALKEMEESLAGLEESLFSQIRILETQLEEMVHKSDSETLEPAKPETPEPMKKESTSRKSPKRS